MRREHIVESKIGLRKSVLADPMFTTRYAFSPYRACEHGCRYCDGRAEKYYVKGNFELDIEIRTNLPSLLEKELPRLREPGVISISSGVSDPYQPAEEKQQLMRRAAEILADHDFPVLLMTKSALALRDLDLWKKVNQRSSVILMVSMTILDEKVREIFEPGASSVKERLSMLRRFKDAGIETALCTMPFLPKINDAEHHLEELFSLARELKVLYVLPGLLTLRPGVQKEVFMRELKGCFGGLVPLYEDIYGEERSSGACRKSYRSAFSARLGKALHNNGLLTMCPHEHYRGHFALYDELFLLMSHMLALYGARGTDIAPLRKARDKYTEWLLSEKKVFNKRRSMSCSDLESKLRFLIGTGEMAKIVCNDKIASFMSEVCEGRCFDYTSLKLLDDDKTSH